MRIKCNKLLMYYLQESSNHRETEARTILSKHSCPNSGRATSAKKPTRTKHELLLSRVTNI